MPEYLKPREAADRLNVNVHTIYRWVKAGQLNSVRIGTGGRIRIPAKDVSDMLTSTDESASL